MQTMGVSPWGNHSQNYETNNLGNKIKNDNFIKF